ncbi:MAG: metal ABC transporter permease [Pseudomonadota bacterium]|nr:metal ABC transporter permease [Pseudomonadota bacterium]
MDDLFTKALLAGVGVSLAAAPLGCFVVWRRMSYFGSTIAHSGLLGAAAGLLLAIDPTIGVIVVAVLLAALLAALQRQRTLPSDTLLGILAHVSLAAGFIVAGMLGGSRIDLMSYLFGDVLAVSSRDLVWIYGGGATVLALAMWVWRPLLAMSVHEELAQAEGVNVPLANAVFMLLLAVTVALAMKVVGILLIASLLVIPAAAARPFSSTPEQMAALAALIAAAAVGAGLASAFWLDLPAGPSIVMMLALLFGLSLFGNLRAASR